MTDAQQPQHRAVPMQRLDVRFTSADRLRVRRAAAAAGLRPSQYVRAAALDAAALRRDSSATPFTTTITRLADTDRALILGAQLDIRRLGVNLNQLTRLAHRGQLDLGQLAPVVDELVARVDDLAQRLGRHR